MGATKKKALGKGLQALLNTHVESVENTATYAITQTIPIAHIQLNPFQPRKNIDPEALKKLAASIDAYGIIQPITVKKINATHYQLIAGERRLQAARLVNLSAIPAYICDANEKQMMAMAIIENIQREDLNPIEIALSYHQLIQNYNLSHETLGKEIGKNRSTISNYLRLLKLPPIIQVALRDHQLTMGHARALISIKHPYQQLSLFQKILKQGLSVRKIEEIVKGILENNTEKNNTKNKKDAMLQDREKNLAQHLKTKVSISNKTKGKIYINFNSPEELDRIIDILSSTHA